MSFLERIRREFHPLHALRKSKAFRILCIRFDRRIKVTISGINFPLFAYVVKNFNLMLGRSLHEGGELRNFVALARENDATVFWDIGANVGLYGFSFISMNAKCSAVLFEPDPDNLAALTDTIRVNALENQVSLRKCAVGAALGSADFKRDMITGATGALANGDPEGVFVERHFDVVPETIEVPVTTLDVEAGSTRPPDIMKIDVEGHEWDVLQGALTLLREHGPMVLFETSRDHDAISKTLKDLGYEFRNAETGEPIDEPAHNTFALAPRHRWPR